MKNLSLILSLLIGLSSAASPAYFPLAQTDPAADLLADMSPAERVGQLFLITFDGAEVDEDSPIYDLVINHHISGVILASETNNFTEPPSTLSDLKDLIYSLQDLNREMSRLRRLSNLQDPGNPPPVYVPLFVAVDQSAGNGMLTKVLDGLSEVPSQMAIGATWDPELALQAGSTLGRELEALGFNMLIGPSLDVLEDTRVSQSGDIGIQSFGGDPYWVSQMGTEFIEGVHTGSQGHLSVIATHFPGLGSSDRSSDQEVATVRKSLEQLKQIELPPFFAVAESPPGESPATADGFMTSHIRYQGFTGNIRATTRPVSLDPQAFSQLMALEPFAAWREGGGIALSDKLGARSIRRFRDPLELTFQSHLVARDAFLAGNDLLWIEEFQNPEDPDEYSTILSTLEFFTSKYLEDPSFAQRIDRSALRILRLKLRLFGNFDSAGVLDPINEISLVGSDVDTSTVIASRAATLISPDQGEIEDRIGGKPAIGERIVFFTDSRSLQRCETCTFQVFPPNALETTIVRLFGPGGTGEAGSWNLSSFTMADLSNYLGAPPREVPITPLSSAEDVEEAIRFADWLVFSVLDIRDDVYGTQALKLLLDQRPDLARDKKLIVFAHDIPYSLDATDISKVDVYYGLFDSSSAFVDMSARLLFFEDSALSASPVSIPGVGYDLITVTSPDPAQVIQLDLVDDVADPIEGEVEGAPQGFQVGDIVTVGAGPILDMNGNSVPDRTPVEFVISQQVEGIPSYTLVSNTDNGIAEVNVPLDRIGLISITAESGQARTSQTLQLNVQQGIPAIATVISPTPLPTSTTAPTDTPSSPTPTPSVDGTAADDSTAFDDLLGFGDLVTGLVASAMIGAAALFLVEQWVELRGTRIRMALIAFAGGMLGYNYLAFSLPGSVAVLTSTGSGGVFLTCLFTGAIGVGIAVLLTVRGQEPVT